MLSGIKAQQTSRQKKNAQMSRKDRSLSLRLEPPRLSWVTGVGTGLLLWRGRQRALAPHLQPVREVTSAAEVDLCRLRSCGVYLDRVPRVPHPKMRSCVGIGRAGGSLGFRCGCIRWTFAGAAECERRSCHLTPAKDGAGERGRGDKVHLRANKSQRRRLG